MTTPPAAPAPAAAAAPAGPETGRRLAHVACIMDGNGRWAGQRGLPRTDGHTEGEENLARIVRVAVRRPIGWLTVFGFSTENWVRPRAEVRHILGLHEKLFGRVRELNELNVRIQFEPAADPSADLSGIFLKPVSEPIDAAALATVQQDLVERIAEASGYGRVMLYEFKADWSGEVVAEKASRVAGTYLGLRFPASDIPAIARALYAQLPYRHIPDVYREPITILGSSGQGTALDLTWSDLRSVSPVHLEYLRNMRVAAAFSVSVMVEGKLWGLVACHHAEPLKVPVAARLRCHEMVSEYVTALLSHRQQSRDERLARLDDSMAQVVQALGTGGDIAATLQGSLANLAQLLDAESGVIVVGDQTAYSSAGVTPDMHRAVHDWSVANQLASVAAYERLPDALHDLFRAENGNLCGMLSISVRARHHKNRLVGLYFFRHEESMEIAWAGNPEKRMDATDESVRLAPRLSFDKWVEVRTGYSRPWDPLTMFTATQLQRRLEAIL